MLVPADQLQSLLPEELAGLSDYFSFDSQPDKITITIMSGYGLIVSQKLSSLLAIAIKLNNNNPPHVEVWEGNESGRFLRVQIAAQYVAALSQDSDL